MTEKNKGGRPTRYRADYARQAGIFARKGFTVQEIAEVLDVTISTIYLWMEKHPKFSEALNEGRASYDERIEVALAERALGYSHPEDKIFCNKDGEVTVVPTVKHYPPDTAAAFIWLKNRQPDRWRDRQEVEVTASEELTQALEKARRRAITRGVTIEGSAEPGD